MKLWEKGIKTDQLIERFTIGKDSELDLLLAPYDILGSIAHVIMLHSIGLLSDSEYNDLRHELILLYETVKNGEFIIEEGVEDVHSQVELLLTRKLGDTGKKIHTARSRNDQVLLDLKLYIRDELQLIVELTKKLFDKLISQSEKYKHILIPGYTHLQIAMPSSFGLWFGAFAENLSDDMQMLLTAYRIADQNPLGSAAGYGSSFPINRKLTTELLGFAELNYNVINAQMSRGKTELLVSFALASLAGTLSKLACDICLFTSQNFGFLKLPDELTTGSSIMPHKKNPDVFELIRAKCNKIQVLPNEINSILTNLPSGYFRDMQIIKESFLPVFTEMRDCLSLTVYAVSKIEPVDQVLNDRKYEHIFSVETANKLVIKGMPFRDAYKKVALEISKGTFHPEQDIQYTHEGSIGNLCNDEIILKMKKVFKKFNFVRKDTACLNLIKEQTNYEKPKDSSSD
jgi:argininosuccinate lyase